MCSYGHLHFNMLFLCIFFNFQVCHHTLTRMLLRLFEFILNTFLFLFSQRTSKFCIELRSIHHDAFS